MHVHFDEEKFERDLRNVFDKMKADPEIHEQGSVVLDRNREVSVQMGMMVCRELNRGTELGDIMSAGIAAFVEFFSNIKEYVEDDNQTAMAFWVAQDTVNGIMDIVRGEGFQVGEPATMQEIQGGRA
ncbi:hypothetical protein [Rhizobium leguminosarum]|uniref:hypothetical protein n=1 Tax=Rhizobium leguminosarum TaxID=384 RepID=UPI00161E3CFF|nr:hypothetical protein [Rhizobium leguminosarum]MBB4342103.1 hypothetical protein [Rhizobium leguminosarum]MBB6294727.1 hypothetical protein [Rhizobium leguminosarum]